MQPTPQPPNEPADPRTESLPTDDSRTDRLAPSPPARWEWWILGGILLLGFALRAMYLVDLSHTPDFFFPKVDAEFHDYWARGAVSGDWRTRPAHEDPRIYETPYLRPPGYPLFLALVYWATGSSYVAARMVQMLLGLVNVVLAFGLARALFGRAAGLVSALLLATYWAFIYFEGELLAPVLLVLLLLAILHLAHLWAVRAGWVFALAAGIAIGIVGDAGVRAVAMQPKMYVGMVLILIFAEALGLYGLIVGLIMTSHESTSCGYGSPL